MAYTNSSLVSYTKLSPNHSGQRTHSIDRITPHCVVGQLTAESICGCFTSPSREASCNYGIGKDGKIALCVEEKNRSWCSSSSANDQRAVTIECASDLNHPYTMTTAVYNSLVKLCTDICKRNGKKKLLWLGDKNKTLNYSPKSDEMVLTVHRWFANKSSPGDWLYSRLGDLASKEGASLLQIGRGLEADGILTGAGKTKWRPETLKKILQNEKYIGDALLQKTYTVDFLNKKRVQNKGIVPQYYVENSHEPIIPRDLYMQVQEEMIRRANLHSGANRKKRVYSSKYALSSIVYCS